MAFLKGEEYVQKSIDGHNRSNDGILGGERRFSISII